MLLFYCKILKMIEILLKLIDILIVVKRESKQEELKWLKKAEVT